MMSKNCLCLIFIGLFLISCLDDCTVFAKTMSISLTDKVDMDFVLIASGSFVRLPRKYEIPEEPKTLESFYLGKCEVTQAQWRAVMGSLPAELYYNAEEVSYADEKTRREIISYSLIRARGRDVAIEEIGIGDDYPVYWISFYDAVCFCNTLSITQGLQPCYKIEEYHIIWNEDCNGYRLPTDDEWEYAVTCGSYITYEYYWGNEIDEAYMNHVNEDIVASPTLFIQVGQKLPNSWGLYDMIGNVLEWCWYRLPPSRITEEDVERWRNDPMESWRIHTEPVHPTHSIRGYDLGSRVEGSYSASHRKWNFGFRVARAIKS